MGEWDVRYLGSRERARDTRTFAFERPAGLEYLPGHFFFVLLDRGSSHQLEHHFSFSSSPTEPRVEFTTRMTGHEFKERLMQLEVGEVVHIAGPDGMFVIRPQDEKVAYLCPGIGVTPARSTVRWALDTGASLDVVVLYGNHSLQDAAFREEFDAIESDHVRVVQVLSNPPHAWQGPRGHIDADLVRREIPDWAQRRFLISGAAGVVNELARVLVEDVGVPHERVMSEHFPGYA